MNILDFLPTGEQNAISTKQLVALCGYTTARDLQSAIEVLRNRGEIICSTSRPPGGYYFPADEMELRRYVRTNRNRAINTLRSTNGAYRKLKAMERDEGAV